MLRKVVAFTLLLPAFATADPLIRDCRAFLLDMSTLGFRAGICRKNIEQPEVVRLRARERECSTISADGELREEIRVRQLALHDEFVNEAVCNTGNGGGGIGRQTGGCGRNCILRCIRQAVGRHGAILSEPRSFSVPTAIATVCWNKVSWALSAM